jgi:hypothetical protein
VPAIGRFSSQDVKVDFTDTKIGLGKGGVCLHIITSRHVTEVEEMVTSRYVTYGSLHNRHARKPRALVQPAPFQAIPGVDDVHSVRPHPHPKAVPNGR